MKSVVDAREHVAHFYTCEHELITHVSAYVLDALTSGETAMVVAIRSHMTAFEAVLVDAGVDLARVRSEGRFVTFDADEALRRFIVDDWPDADAFAEELGELTPRLIETGRPLRVYGEMVSLLWQAGHVGAAIELEKMWNELLQRFSFGVYCAYPTHSLAVARTPADSIRQICDCHAAVIGEPPITGLGGADAAREFAWDLVAVGASRRFVAETLEAWGLPDVIDDAMLIVSELATNAVMHARSTFTVLLSWEAETLCISVRDASAVVPTVRSPAATMISGRGLPLVAAFASRWGTDVDGHGKLVWAELPTS